MKIAVVGSRTWTNVKFVEDALADIVGKADTIVSGGAWGVDTIAENWARRAGIGVIRHVPDVTPNCSRQEYTIAAYARNQLIVDDCDMVIAFVDKLTGGTWDTIRRAYKAGKFVNVFIEKGESND